MSCFMGGDDESSAVYSKETRLFEPTAQYNGVSLKMWFGKVATMFWLHNFCVVYF